MSDDAGDQAEAWEILYARILELIGQFGSEDYRMSADCWVDDDNIGTTQQKIYVRNLTLLRPQVIASLQDLVRKFPGWEIMVAVSVPGPGETWPDMGLTIRAREIVDGLQRQYFPKEFQSIQYEGSRRGTERD